MYSTEGAMPTVHSWLSLELWLCHTHGKIAPCSPPHLSPRGSIARLSTVCHLKHFAIAFSAVDSAYNESSMHVTVIESHTHVQDRQTVALPRRPNARSASSTAKLSILKVLEFSSQTLRSGAVVLSEDAPHGSALLFLRGAPAVIKGLVDPATVPVNFDQVLVPHQS